MRGVRSLPPQTKSPRHGPEFYNDIWLMGGDNKALQAKASEKYWNESLEFLLKSIVNLVVSFSFKIQGFSYFSEVRPEIRLLCAGYLLRGTRRENSSKAIKIVSLVFPDHFITFQSFEINN